MLEIFIPLPWQSQGFPPLGKGDFFVTHFVLWGTDLSVPFSGCINASPYDSRLPLRKKRRDSSPKLNPSDFTFWFRMTGHSAPILLL